MSKHPDVVPGNGVSHPLQYAAEVGTKALDAAQAGATWATTRTEKIVRQYPLASVGIAFGGGAALGFLAYRFLVPRHTR
jgi:ElaB/YqjD/DUF883 family membrane-anchored ribosome-binding protein